MLAAFLFAMLPAFADRPVDPKADALLRAARTFVATRSYPGRLSYRVAVTLSGDNGVSTTRTYESGFDGASHDVSTRSISEEENATPFVPRGINVVVGLTASTSTGATGTAVRVNRPADDSDVIGVPMLSPTYTFGLGKEQAIAKDDFAPEFPVIAVVSAATREYDATYIDQESIDGETCAHLQLTPVRDPSRYRIRELWIAADGAPLQAITRGNFVAPPWNGLAWKIRFRRDGPSLYLDTEATEESVRVDRYRHGHVVVAFEAISATNPRRLFFPSLDTSDAAREP